MNLVLTLVSSFWFWADVILSLSGGVIVAWGLSIEKNAEKLIPPADFKPDIFGEIVEAYKREIDRGWRILMAGIIVEVVAALGISIISGLEIADLTEKAASANLEARQAGKDAAEAKLINSITVSNNLVLAKTVEELRSNNIALEAQMSPRMIEESHLGERLKQFSGTKFKIIAASGGDCGDLASQIESILDIANWDDGGIVFTLKPVPIGVAVGLCSTNDGLLIPNSNIDEETWEKSDKAINSLVGELNNGGVDAIMEPAMNKMTSLRFNGILILVGARPIGIDDQIFKAKSEFEELGNKTVFLEQLSPSVAKTNLDTVGRILSEHSINAVWAEKMTAAGFRYGELEKSKFEKLKNLSSSTNVDARFSAPGAILP